ncbi:hypothetical protein K438DRAFT_1577463, partial [Mycena galopus ATCC 62051]
WVGKRTVPSLYGALPSSTPPVITPELSLTFSPLDGTILNSTVIGPKSRTYFRISTDSASSGSQWFKITNLKVPPLSNEGPIQWRSTLQWLALSPDKTHRIMNTREKSFRWTPSQGYIELYSTGVPNPRLFARLSQGQSGVKLELTNEAVHVGLLEVCVASAVLLMSGREVD